MTILIIIRILKNSKYNMSCKHIYEEYYFIHIYEELISGLVYMKGFLNLTDEAIGVHKSNKKGTKGGKHSYKASCTKVMKKTLKSHFEIH